MPRYKVKLSSSERDVLESVVSKGSHTSRGHRNALILLNCDQSDQRPPKSPDDQIASALQTSIRTVERVKQQFVEEGLEACLQRRAYPQRHPLKMDGECEAHLIALCCSKPPDGYHRWSLRLLAERMVELRYVESISHEAVRTTLKKMNSSPGNSFVG